MKNALIFIDTNIFLDFYRIRGDSRLSMLDHITQNTDRIITSNQIQMEFKKNRQKVIIESLGQLRTPDWGGLTAPAFLADTKLAKAIMKNRKYLDDQHKRLKKQLTDILKKPSWYDRVFKVLEKLFDFTGPYNLTRKMPLRYKIRRLARKRFMLGYPPRKDDDTSIGDAVNWEWTIHCAKESRRDIIIVSRDNDYGANHGDGMILNDWLLEEFKSRVSHRRKIMLTDRLSHAFKTIAVPVTKEEEKEETELISSDVKLAMLYDYIRKMILAKKESESETLLDKYILKRAKEEKPEDPNEGKTTP